MARARRAGHQGIGRPLPRSFYERNVVRVARGLLGRLLVWSDPARTLAGIIVEVEAYRGEDDPASHAHLGETRRNRVMYGPPGRAYVYFTYGMHHCLNVVAEEAGRAAAVLVRAVEPVLGLEVMSQRRHGAPWRRLARGPGCVAAAFGLTRAHDGIDLVRGLLWVSDLPPKRRGLRVACSARVGIRRGLEHPWRFYLAGHPCVSRGPNPS